MKKYKVTVIRSKFATDIYIRKDRDTAIGIMKQMKDFFPKAEVTMEEE